MADKEDARLEAVTAAGEAAKETNTVREALTAQQAALAAAVAENAKLRKQLEAGGSGIPLWKPGGVVTASTAWIVPDGTSDNIVIPAGFAGCTLYLGAALYGKNQGRPFLSAYGDRLKVVSIAPDGQANFDVPIGTPINPDKGRYEFAECIRVGREAMPYTSPVRGTVFIDVSANRADALAKCFPDCQSATFIRPRTTDALLADGIFSGGATGVTIIDPDLTAKNENTVRATSQNGVLAKDMTVIGGRVRNTGRKAALNPRNVNGFVAYGVRLFATKNNSAVGIGDQDTDRASLVTIIGCLIEGGSLSLHAYAAGVELLRNRFAWPDTQDNSAIGVNVKASDVTIIGNSGESPVAQKAMVGYAGGDKSKVKGLVEINNGWTVKP